MREAEPPAVAALIRPGVLDQHGVELVRARRRQLEGDEPLAVVAERIDLVLRLVPPPVPARGRRAFAVGVLHGRTQHGRRAENGEECSKQDDLGRSHGVSLREGRGPRMAASGTSVAGDMRSPFRRQLYRGPFPMGADVAALGDAPRGTREGVSTLGPTVDAGGDRGLFSLFSRPGGGWEKRAGVMRVLGGGTPADGGGPLCGRKRTSRGDLRR